MFVCFFNFCLSSFQCPAQLARKRNYSNRGTNHFATKIESQNERSAQGTRKKKSSSGNVVVSGFWSSFLFSLAALFLNVKSFSVVVRNVFRFVLYQQLSYHSGVPQQKKKKGNHPLPPCSVSTSVSGAVTTHTRLARCNNTRKIHYYYYNRNLRPRVDRAREKRKKNTREKKKTRKLGRDGGGNDSRRLSLVARFALRFSRRYETGKRVRVKREK